ncbi:hypothetical protein [Acinetobacter rudis]|uniref:Uncharacterized protein n=1 Tax=Acinetobacter rudis TaxID=632955 RepID=A0AAW8JB35_9GAMM|nr:hypothetical protein [Acinetobacter rudis]MDQ8936167.1 hypothetical protein [Acinetobacter rudis]MDQ8954108.1 hypothetical protein [Acinetobacter rudis]MDQ9018475.1 hypothetical protein [Acinetobacter rudis]
MYLEKMVLNGLPKSIPDFIVLNYSDGDLIACCTWGDKTMKLRFVHVESFRLSLEGLLLKMQASLDFKGDCFVYSGEKLDLYTWINDQVYGYLDTINFHKTMLVSSNEIVEVVYGGEMEIISEFV